MKWVAFFLISQPTSNKKNHVSYLRGLEEEINSEFYQFYLNPVAPGNGAFIMNTYPELLDEVIPKNARHWIWPIYNEDVNANKWHSMCFGLSIEKRISFLVHNGKTQENVTQPEAWADVSRGYDTTAVEPYTSKHPYDRNEENVESLLVEEFGSTDNKNRYIQNFKYWNII